LQRVSTKSCKANEFGRKLLENAAAGLAHGLETGGRRLNVHLKSQGWNHEAARLVTFVNDEVVPAVRYQSCRALRFASRNLRQLTALLDEPAA
jgi:hypothetical protein